MVNFLAMEFNQWLGVNQWMKQGFDQPGPGLCDWTRNLPVSLYTAGVE
jgi:hypothetical protein